VLGTIICLLRQFQIIFKPKIETVICDSLQEDSTPNSSRILSTDFYALRDVSCRRERVTRNVVSVSSVTSFVTLLCNRWLFRRHFVPTTCITLSRIPYVDTLKNTSRIQVKLKVNVTICERRLIRYYLDKPDREITPFKNERIAKLAYVHAFSLSI